MTDFGNELSRVFRSSFPDAEYSGFRTDTWRDVLETRHGKLALLSPTMLHAFALAAKHDSKTGITLIPDKASAPERHRSYRELYKAARSMAGALAALGVRRGDRVLIVLPTSFEFVITFFAAQCLRAVPVAAYPPAALEKVTVALARIAHVAANSTARWCVSNRTLRPILGDLMLRAATLQQVIAVEELVSGDSADAPRPKGYEDDLAFIQYSSGSTGHPKGVAIEHRAVVANTHALGLAARVTRSDVHVSWLPLYHDMGLVGALLSSIYWRMPIVLLAPTTFLFQPKRWLWAIHRHRGTISCAPNFAYGLCAKRTREEDLAGLDLSSWRFALCGAEPIDSKTVRHFQERFSRYGLPDNAIVPAYGMAEACLGLTFARLGAPIRTERVCRKALADGHARPAEGSAATTVVSCGRPLPGHRVLIVDEHGAQLPELEVGHIVVRGPSLMREYFENPLATGAVLKDGWLWSGDLGFFSEGRLYVTGRTKDLIILRGRNYYAEDLERALEQVEGVRIGATVAFGVLEEANGGELVVAVCETRREDPEAQHQLVDLICAQVLERCGVKLDEVVLVPPGTIPRTSSGKRQRALCRDLYLAGNLAAERAGPLQLAMVFARSGAGYIVSGLKRMKVSRRAPD